MGPNINSQKRATIGLESDFIRPIGSGFGSQQNDSETPSWSGLHPSSKCTQHLYVYTYIYITYSYPKIIVIISQ